MMEAIEALSKEPPKITPAGLSAPRTPSQIGAGPSSLDPSPQKDSHEEKRRDEENTSRRIVTDGLSRLKILLVEGVRMESVN